MPVTAFSRNTLVRVDLLGSGTFTGVWRLIDAYLIDKLNSDRQLTFELPNDNPRLASILANASENMIFKAYDKSYPGDEYQQYEYYGEDEDKGSKGNSTVIICNHISYRLNDYLLDTYTASITGTPQVIITALLTAFGASAFTAPALGGSVAYTVTFDQKSKVTCRAAILSACSQIQAAYRLNVDPVGVVRTVFDNYLVGFDLIPVTTATPKHNLQFGNNLDSISRSKRIERTTTGRATKETKTVSALLPETAAVGDVVRVYPSIDGSDNDSYQDAICEIKRSLLNRSDVTGSLLDNASDAAGDFVSQTIETRNLVDGVKPLFAQVRLANNQTIATGYVANKINFDTIISDVSLLWYSVNKRFVVPAGYTKAIISISVALAPNATGYRFVRMRKNGADFPGMIALLETSPSSAYQYYLPGAAEIPCTTNDYFEVSLEQTSGVDLNVNGGNSTWFSILLIP